MQTSAILTFLTALLDKLELPYLRLTAIQPPVRAHTHTHRLVPALIYTVSKRLLAVLELHGLRKYADYYSLLVYLTVQRVACVGDRLLVKLTDSAMAHKWRVGQVVVGGLKWGCNASHAHPRSRAIYVKISAIAFPLEDQVVVHHVPAG